MSAAFVKVTPGTAGLALLGQVSGNAASHRASQASLAECHPVVTTVRLGTRSELPVAESRRSERASYGSPRRRGSRQRPREESHHLTTEKKGPMWRPSRCLHWHRKVPGWAARRAADGTLRV